MLPAEGIEPAEARELLYAAVEKAMNELTAAKLEQVKRKMTADLVYVNDNPEDAAYWIGYMLSNGFSLDEAENYEAQINKVTLNGVKKAFKQLMQTAKVYGTLLSDENKGEKNGPKTR
jgi:predicted Zn-dependent peptidase